MGWRCNPGLVWPKRRPVHGFHSASALCGFREQGSTRKPVDNRRLWVVVNLNRTTNNGDAPLAREGMRHWRAKDGAVILETRSLTKTYGRLCALRDCSLS